MKVYRHWAKVYVDKDGRQASADASLTGAVGWSDDSAGAAETSALERARRFATMIREGVMDRLRSRYAYLDRPVREPIVDEMIVDNQRVAAITRNAYGAYILNCARVLFADIDRRPNLSESFRMLWQGLRGQRVVGFEQRLLQNLQDIARTHDLSMRVYRTRGGHRACVTSRTYEPDDPASRALLEACGSDPLYVQLCAGQQCYRARLSPKPWRIGIRQTPRFRFPYASDAQREQFEQWSARYEQVAAAWTACEPIADFGDHPVHPAVQPIVDLHDTLACAAGKPLA